VVGLNPMPTSALKVLKQKIYRVDLDEIDDKNYQSTLFKVRPKGGEKFNVDAINQLKQL
jgi:hypothetical protein